MRSSLLTNCMAPGDLQDALDALVDMREYDVPYHMRFQIDTDVRCGLWYDVRAKVTHLSSHKLRSHVLLHL